MQKDIQKKNKNVLLVDDDKVFNFLSTKTVEEIGFAKDIHVALNGKEAIDLFNSYYSKLNSLPDIILLDINMPIMDGFEFIRAFKQLQIPGEDQVHIIIVSSSFDKKDKDQALSLGIEHFLNKPLTKESLQEALDSLMN